MFANFKQAVVLSLFGFVPLSAFAQTAQQVFDKDIQDSLTIPLRTAQGVDEKYQNMFSKLFGERSSKAVQTFITRNLKYAFYPEDIIMTPMDVHLGGSVTQTTLRNFVLENGGEDLAGEVINPNTGASNADMYLADKWFRLMQFRRDHTPGGVADWAKSIFTKVENYLVIHTGDHDLKIDGQVGKGFFTLGRGYFTGATAYGSSQNEYPLTARIHMLVHEARHSDCPTGMGTAECGHPHAECPAGHDLEGTLSCDSEPWGSYSTGLIYILGTFKNSPEDSEERRVLEQILDDTLGRINIGVWEAMVSSTPTF